MTKLPRNLSIERKPTVNKIDPDRHLFEIGQTVRLKGSPVDDTNTFQITGLLPALNRSPQYRMRNDEERYERVTTQDQLEAANLDTRQSPTPAKRD